MGMNTSFMLCNDQLHTLATDPNVGRVLHEMVQDTSAPKEYQRHRHGYLGMQVIACVHADGEQIVSVGRNSGKLLGLGSTLHPLVDAAVALSNTKNPAERRRLIRLIERNATVHAASRQFA